MYARPSPRFGAFSTRAPFETAISDVESVELSIIRISPCTPACSSPCMHQSTNCPIVSSSFSAGMTMERSGSATSLSGSSRRKSGSPLMRRTDWSPTLYELLMLSPSLQSVSRMSRVVVEDMHRLQRVLVEVLAHHLELAQHAVGAVMMWHPTSFA